MNRLIITYGDIEVHDKLQQVTVKANSNLKNWGFKTLDQAIVSLCIYQASLANNSLT